MSKTKLEIGDEAGSLIGSSLILLGGTELELGVAELELVGVAELEFGG